MATRGHFRPGDAWEACPSTHTSPSLKALETQMPANNNRDLRIEQEQLKA
jgi:hypothetical protein